MKTLAFTSGYFDPIHIGHLELFEKARKMGCELLVIVNNDKQSILKKGFVFMPETERLRIVTSIRTVNSILLSKDLDTTVCETIKFLKRQYPNYQLIFCKGGDRLKEEIPEKEICDELGIKIVDNLGQKIQSSSELLKRWKT